MLAKLNWRGAFSKESANDLLVYGFTKEFLKLLSVMVLEKGLQIYLKFVVLCWPMICWFTDL